MTLILQVHRHKLLEVVLRMLLQQLSYLCDLLLDRLNIEQVFFLGSGLKKLLGFFILAQLAQEKRGQVIYGRRELRRIVSVVFGVA